MDWMYVGGVCFAILAAHALIRYIGWRIWYPEDLEAYKRLWRERIGRLRAWWNQGA